MMRVTNNLVHQSLLEVLEKADQVEYPQFLAEICKNLV